MVIDKLTIGYPYYDSRFELETIVDHYNRMPKGVRNKLHMIIVDDGSPNYPARDYIHGHKFPITLARIHEDIYNNCAGANNLIMHLATGLVVKIDIDYMLDADTIVDISYNGPESNEALFYFRDVERDWNHPNIYAIRQDTFWKTGGYDEDFSGGKGYSDLILHHRMRTSGIEVEFQNRYNLISLNAPSCNFRKKNADRNKDLHDQKFERIKEGTYKQQPILRFCWTVVYGKEHL